MRSDLQVLPDGDQHRIDPVSEGRPAPPGDDAGIGLHTREVIWRQGGWHFKCGCNFVSREYELRYRAEFDPCPVEVLLAESAERLARLTEKG